MISWEDLQLANSLQSAYLLMFSAPASCDWALLDRRAKLPTKLCPVPFDGITRGQEPCSLLCSDANLNTVALSELSVSCGWIWMSLCSSISLFWLKLQSCSRRTSLGKEKRTGFLGPWWARAMTIILSFHNLCCPLMFSRVKTVAARGRALIPHAASLFFFLFLKKKLYSPWHPLCKSQGINYAAKQVPLAPQNNFLL